MGRFDDFWSKTKWPTDELDGKRVQFVLSNPGERVSGTGTFRVLERPNSEQLVDIIVPVVRTPTEGKDQIFTLTPRHAKAIEKHPDPTVAEFQCIT